MAINTEIHPNSLSWPAWVFCKVFRNKFGDTGIADSQNNCICLLKEFTFMNENPVLGTT